MMSNFENLIVPHRDDGVEMYHSVKYFIISYVWTLTIRQLISISISLFGTVFLIKSDTKLYFSSNLVRAPVYHHQAS